MSKYIQPIHLMQFSSCTCMHGFKSFSLYCNVAMVSTEIHLFDKLISLAIVVTQDNSSQGIIPFEELIR